MMLKEINKCTWFMCLKDEDSHSLKFVYMNQKVHASVQNTYMVGNDF